MMNENTDTMRERHKKEIEFLQQKYAHTELSDWMEEWWAPAHLTNYMIRECKFCGKIVEKKEFNAKIQQT